MKYPRTIALLLPAAAMMALPLAGDVVSDTNNWFAYPVGPSGVPVDLSFLSKDAAGNFVPAGAHGFLVATNGNFMFEDGTPAIAVRKNTFGGNEVFLGTPACPPELVRALEDLAGVHRYVKDGRAAVWAAEGWLSAMADEQGGRVTFDTGVAGPVTDFFTGKKIADGPVFTLDMAPGETRLFEFAPRPGTRNPEPGARNQMRRLRGVTGRLCQRGR